MLEELENILEGDVCRGAEGIAKKEWRLDCRAIGRLAGKDATGAGEEKGGGLVWD